MAKPEHVIPLLVDRIFERAETDPFLSLRHPDQVIWRHTESNVSLSRFPEERFYTLQISTIDPEIVSSSFYVFNGRAILEAISSCLPTSEAHERPFFLFDAVHDPLNQGAITDTEEEAFFATLLSGLRPGPNLAS